MYAVQKAVGVQVRLVQIGNEFPIVPFECVVESESCVLDLAIFVVTLIMQFSLSLAYDSRKKCPDMAVFLGLQECYLH